MKTIPGIFLLFFLIGLIKPAWSQKEANLSGYITTTDGEAVYLATLSITGTGKGVTTDTSGFYSIDLPSGKPLILRINHVNYLSESIRLTLGEGEFRKLDVQLQERTRVLDSVEIRSGREEDLRNQASVTLLRPKDINMMPVPFGEVGHLIATLPGVVSNNELSSTYSVRGGNFEENLIYVNGIPVYRPFLIRAGEQEGLSFVNPDLTDDLIFSSGGWAPEYGDKLSSVLNVSYREPEDWGGSVMAGLLGGSFHLEGASRDQKLTFIGGVRHKRTEYLLNTFETRGEYLPRFTDFQGYLKIKPGKPDRNGQYRTYLGILLAFSENRYKVVPENRETSFGTFNTPLNLFVAFDGRESLNYTTLQAAVKLNHRFSEKLRSHLMVSNYFTRERENFEVEAGYRLCDVDKRPGSETFKQCLTIRGIGTDYAYGRNRLDGQVINAEAGNELVINRGQVLKWGAGYAFQHFDDLLDEYSFVDSADFITVTEVIRADQETHNHNLTGYVQHEARLAERHFFNYGIRMNYMSINRQFLISPRLQYAYRPDLSDDIVIRASAGLYQQPPFYREFRRFNGTLNRNVKAQSSLHLITGVDYQFLFWGRPFSFTAEAYYKHMENINPYDIDNVRIRYYATNDASAYAAGLDFRISGEFIPGDQSWFSLGFLSTREDLAGDDRGYMPRPTDQLVNFNVLFRDHIPQFPSYRVFLNLNLASGLPFGPPGNIRSRNGFRGESYQRVDLGFSKVFTFSGQQTLESLWIGLEVLNLTGRANSITYYWVRDFNNIYYGVPNALTTRFFNLKLILRT